MQIRIAQPEDSKALVNFYKEFPLQGQVEIKVDRFNDYFAPYQVQSDRYLSYLMEDDVKTIHGTASFVIQNLHHQGQLQTVAWGRDLRIANNRQAVLNWSQHFLPVLNEVAQTFQTQFTLSVINLADTQALNAFVRLKPSKRPLPRYYLFRRLNLISVHGQLPWANNPLPHLRIKHAQPHHADALAHYVVKKSLERDLASVWNADSFFDKIHRYKNLRLEDFLIAVDHQDNIVGCCAPWSSANIQEQIPLHYSTRGHNFRQFLKFGEQFGWTRSLTKPIHRLQTEASFNFRYLNFLFANNADIFESLLWSAYDNVNENEFLVYSQMRSEPLYRRPFTWITAKRQYGVYLIAPPDTAPPDFLHPRNERSIEIEPFFI
ncbi:MAG: hypothetical protein ACLGGX_04885 [Bdellovibrionia bacterium]